LLKVHGWTDCRPIRMANASTHRPPSPPSPPSLLPPLLPLQAYFHRSSRWTPWQQEGAPQQLLDEYQQRLAANHVAGWAPASPDELLAVTSRRDQPYSTLRQVLLDTPAAQPHCYRVLVRLMEFTPAQPADMCHPASACGLPGAGRRVVRRLGIVTRQP
jgi:hypothetical protein